MTKQPFVIGVCGGSSSGKTTLAKRITDNMIKLGKKTTLVSQDWFYYNLTAEQLDKAHKNSYNFDTPNAIDFTDLKRVIQELIGNKQPVQVPTYDFSTFQRVDIVRMIEPSDIIILEGIFIFCDPDLRNMMNVLLFVDVDADTRLVRRIRRDLESRGMDLSSVLDTYERFVKPGFEQFIWPTKRWAHLIIPDGGDNQIAIDLITHLLTKV